MRLCFACLCALFLACQNIPEQTLDEGRDAPEPPLVTAPVVEPAKPVACTRRDDMRCAEPATPAPSQPPITDVMNGRN